MAEPELLLDSNIRLWVVLPIVFITFFVGVIRHYVSILLQSDKKLTLEQVSDRCVCVFLVVRCVLCFCCSVMFVYNYTLTHGFSQVLIRSRILRENGKYIPKQVESPPLIIV